MTRDELESAIRSGEIIRGLGFTGDGVARHACTRAHALPDFFADERRQRMQRAQQRLQRADQGMAGA